MSVTVRGVGFVVVDVGQCAGFWRHVYAKDTDYTIHLDMWLMIEGRSRVVGAADTRQSQSAGTLTLLTPH